METNSKESVEILVKNEVEKNAILLSDLIVEINIFLDGNKQNIGKLAEILKRIFFYGIKCRINVSKKIEKLHQKFNAFSKDV